MASDHGVSLGEGYLTVRVSHAQLNKQPDAPLAVRVRLRTDAPWVQSAPTDSATENPKWNFETKITCVGLLEGYLYIEVVQPRGDDQEPIVVAHRKLSAQDLVNPFYQGDNSRRDLHGLPNSPYIWVEGTYEWSPV